MKNGKMRYAYEDDSSTVPKSGGIVEELLLKEKNGKGKRLDVECCATGL